MGNRLNLRKGQAGQILMYVVIVLALAAIIAPSVYYLVFASHHQTQKSTENLQMYYAADTGVENALQQWQQWAGGPFTFPETNVNGYPVQVGVNLINGVYVITSTAGGSGGTQIVVKVSQYTLTISSSAGGNVTVTPPGPPTGNVSSSNSPQTFTYPEGAQVGLKVAAADCHYFGGWTGGPTISQDPNDPTQYTITMKDNYTITANFQWQTTLTINSTPGGHVTTPGEGTFGYCTGALVPLEIQADPGYNFVQWSGTDISTIQFNTVTHSGNITMNGNYTITAEFTEVPHYWLYVSSTAGGTVTNPTVAYPPGWGNFTDLAAGSSVTLQVQPDSCHVFAGWTGDVGTIPDRFANPGNITMNGNYSIQANFQQIQYNLTMNVDPPGGGTVGNGTVSAATWSGTWLCGDQRIVATPAAGYTFTYWSGDTTTIADIYGNDTTIAMHGNYSIVANFYLTTPACNCFHYAAGTLGTTPPTFQNSGKVNGDVFVSGAAGLSNAFTLNGNLYVKGDATLQNAINVNGDVYVLGNLIASNSQRIYGNVYATGNVTLQNGATVTKSVYAQGSIWLTNASQIQGNAHYQGTISMSGASSVLGSLYHETVTLPPFPTFTPPTADQITATANAYKGNASLGGTTGSVTINSNQSLGPKYITGNLNISNNKTLTLTGTIYVEGTITLGQNAQIVLGAGDPASNPWAIVAYGGITINNNASVNSTHATPLPVIMSVNGSITVTGSSDIGGILYAPNGTVTLSNSVTVYGAAVGQVVNTSSSTTITHAPGLESRTDLPSCGCGP